MKSYCCPECNARLVKRLRLTTYVDIYMSSHSGKPLYSVGAELFPDVTCVQVRCSMNSSHKIPDWMVSELTDEEKTA